MFFVLVKPEQKVEHHDFHEVSCANNMKAFYSLSFSFYQGFEIQSFKGKQTAIVKNSYIYKRTDYKLITLNPQVKHQIIGYQIFNNMNRLNPVHESRENFKVT